MTELAGASVQAESLEPNMDSPGYNAPNGDRQGEPAGGGTRQDSGQGRPGAGEPNGSSPGSRPGRTMPRLTGPVSTVTLGAKGMAVLATFSIESNEEGDSSRGATPDTYTGSEAEAIELMVRTLRLQQGQILHRIAEQYWRTRLSSVRGQAGEKRFLFDLSPVADTSGDAGDPSTDKIPPNSNGMREGLRKALCDLRDWFGPDVDTQGEGDDSPDDRRVLLKAILDRCIAEGLESYLRENGMSFSLTEGFWGPKLLSKFQRMIEGEKDDLLRDIAYTTVQMAVPLPGKTSPELERLCTEGLSVDTNASAACVLKVYPEATLTNEYLRVHENKRPLLDSHLRRLIRLDESVRNVGQPFLRFVGESPLSAVSLPPLHQMIIEGIPPLLYVDQARLLLTDYYYFSQDLEQERKGQLNGVDRRHFLLWLKNVLLEKTGGESERAKALSWIESQGIFGQRDLFNTLWEFSSLVLETSQMLSYLYDVTPKKRQEVHAGPDGETMYYAGVRTKIDAVVVSGGDAGFHEAFGDAVFKAGRGGYEPKRAAITPLNDALQAVAEFQLEWERYLADTKIQLGEQNISSGTVMRYLLSIAGLLMNGHHEYKEWISTDDLRLVFGKEFDETLWKEIWRTFLADERERLLMRPYLKRAREIRDQLRSEEFIRIPRSYLLEMLQRLDQRMTEDDSLVVEERTITPDEIAENIVRLEDMLTKNSTGGRWIAVEELESLIGEIIWRQMWKTMLSEEREVLLKSPALQKALIINDLIESDDFLGLPVAYLIRLARWRTQEILDEYEAAGGSIPVPITMKLLEFKFVHWKRLSDAARPSVISKEFLRQSLIMAITGPMARGLNMTERDSWDTVLGLNLLLNGKFVNLVSQIIAFPALGVHLGEQFVPPKVVNVDLSDVMARYLGIEYSRSEPFGRVKASKVVRGGYSKLQKETRHLKWRIYQELMRMLRQAADQVEREKARPPMPIPKA